MFCAADFTSVRRSVSPESMLFLYSDRITESTDKTGDEFDLNRLTEALLQSRNRLPSELVETIQRNIIGFTNGTQPSDDRTMFALRWSPKGI